LLHPDEFEPGAVGDPLWVPVHMVMLTAFVLMVPGMFAIHARHQRSATLVVGALGSILAVVIAGLEAFALPPLFAHAAVQRPLMEQLFTTLELRPIGILFALTIPTWIAGYVMTGVACLKSPLPRTASWMLIAGSVLCAAPVHFFGGAGPIVKLCVGAAYGGGLAWLGLSLCGAKVSARRDHMAAVSAVTET
jgi:hypothetical protein